jgi:hypothetical protein
MGNLYVLILVTMVSVSIVDEVITYESVIVPISEKLDKGGCLRRMNSVGKRGVLLERGQHLECVPTTPYTWDSK